MKNKILIAFALSTAVLFSAPGPATAQKDAEPTKTDNTKMNKPAPDGKEVTADQQKEKASDRKLSQQIRRAVVKKKSLSMYAHNVKIITIGGAVTLKGPVRSEKEKAYIEDVAAHIAGKENVTSKLTVEPKEKEDKQEDQDKKEQEQEKK